MAGHFVESRREFLQGVGAAGVALIVRNFSTVARGGVADKRAWMAAPGKARYRIDGIAKVRGEKIFARDFRAADFKGWPHTERGALVIRAIHVDRRFEGLDLSMLANAGVMPRRVVLAENLAADKIAPSAFQQPPAGLASGLLVARGEMAAYYGQPLALLIFDDCRMSRRARKAVQFEPAVVRYGRKENVETPTVPYSPATYVTLYHDAEGERFSQAKKGRANPYAAEPSEAGRQARQWRERIEQNIGDPQFQVFAGTYATQSLDPVFMEPEGGLAWLERTRQHATLHLVLGTQSGSEDLLLANGLFDNGEIKTVVVNSCFPGGGFGGRVGSPFPALLSIAAFYCDGPVRMAFDRFEQFQAGLKQLASNIAHRVAVDGEGSFRAINSKVTLLAGGNNNLSEWVAQFAGYCALGGYAIGQAAVDAMAMPTRGVVAGSMRGFGGPQAAFAIELLVDEIAERLSIDPIALRRRNVLQSGDATVTGARPAQVMRLADICDLAAGRTLWREREHAKSQRSTGGKLRGVGFALANQAFGTGADGVMAEVSISRDGDIAIRTTCVDMGNGSATTLAVGTHAILGQNAGTVSLGDTTGLTAALGLDAPPARGSRDWSDPHWTPVLSGPSSACLTAFHHTHAVQQAAAALFRTGILTAAHSLWGLAAPAYEMRLQPGVQFGAAAAPLPHWVDGVLVSEGHRALGPAELAAEIYRRNLVSGATIHALHLGQWVQADYEVDGCTVHMESDCLATRLADGRNWRKHGRRKVVAPAENAFLLGRILYAPSGALVAIEVDRASGQVSVTEVELFLDAGRVIQPDIVAGQADGGVAMGIGYALMENAQNGDAGPGNGQWNLHCYQVPLVKHVPIGNLKLTLLGGDDATAKGIAEAVLCPIPAAIANAVAHATGQRPRSLPITPDWVRRVLA